MVDLVHAIQIAERYILGLSTDAGVRLTLLEDRTEERDFGWVFYYGQEDVRLQVAGNAPFIVDRKQGSIFPTGTALPTAVYLENYARTGRTFPPGEPEHTVVIEGWAPGKPAISKIPLTKAIRAATGTGLAEAKAHTDAVVAGLDVLLMFPSADEANSFCDAVGPLGATVRRENR
jgi:hypothetical protein